MNLKQITPEQAKNIKPKVSIPGILIIGFDTEYQTREMTASNGDLYLENELLSYQYSCKIIHEHDLETCLTWSGIIWPTGPTVDDRISLPEFVGQALANGKAQHPSADMPSDIYLVAHFTRADVPAFSEFKDKHTRDGLNLDNLRNSFVNLKKDIKLLQSGLPDAPDRVLSVKLRDTIHLAPAGARKLDDLGKILGFEKFKVSDDPDKELFYKKNMKSLLEDDPDLFERYAMRDAEICTLYTEEMIRLNQQECGAFKMPATLSAIGVDLITDFWAKRGMTTDEVVGTEEVEKRTFVRKDNRYHTRKVTQLIKQLFWNQDFLTECYHGGRNEAFWSGPGPEGLWFDYDLTGAYPTAMALIGQADWRDIKQLTDTDELLGGTYGPTDLVFANVDFEFPERVRFPVLPVRTENGLIFPRRGSSSTHISEILLARDLGAKISLIEGRVIASVGGGLHGISDNIKRPFVDFTKFCNEQRAKYPKKTMMNLFWKEVANSTYGKTAQGMRERRVYDLREKETKPLDPSKITNPAYAAFITAMCRGVLGEIMNALPETVDVFSVTTDGFLTTATDAQMQAASQGPLSRYYSKAREALVGQGAIYEVKHVIRQPLGWRTRAQATIQPAAEEDFVSQDVAFADDTAIVLAKGGIKLEHKLAKPEENAEILDLYFNRYPGQQLHMTLGMGIRQMYEDGLDFVDRTMIKKLSMEFDWKRKPCRPRDVDVILPNGKRHRHLSFETVPWEDINQFQTTRERWYAYNKETPHVIKTADDLAAFDAYLARTLSGDERSRAYLRGPDSDLVRVRRDIAIAHKFRKAGTHAHKLHNIDNEVIYAKQKLPAKVLAERLNRFLSIPVSEVDVYNARKKKVFTPHQVPRTNRAVAALETIKEVFPELRVEAFLAEQPPFRLIARD